MNWIKQFVILLAFTIGLMVRSSTGTRFRLQPAESFEFCVARNLSESPIFNEEDKARMSKIVMETDLRMHELKADPANPVNAKTLLRLFAAALACVVSDCDSSVRPQREQACLTALEECAKSLKGPIGDEVVMEMKKIFSAMNREISTLDSISQNSASVEVKKKEQSEKESEEEKTEERLEGKIRERIKERLGESRKSEKKEEYVEDRSEEKEERREEESEIKSRPKRANVPIFQYEAFSAPLQANPTLESILADKLLKSATFNNFFNFGLSENDAVFFSRSMVANGLNGYRYEIIDEAMDAVANAMYRLGTFPGPQDYAYAIGRSIASVLAKYDLTFYADGLDIGSSLVYQLDTMLRSNVRSTLSLTPSFGAVSVSSSAMASSSAVVSSQTGSIASVQGNPSYVEPSFSIPSNTQNDKTQFQNRLSYFLFQSEVISAAFCNGPFLGLNEVMSTAFADFGFPIASTIATVVTNSLTMIPPDAACTQYSDVISEIVTEIFDNNGLILDVDPQVITNKISDSIRSKIQSETPQNPSGFGQQTFSGSEYELNPSFSDYSYSAPEIPVPPVDQYPDSGFSGYKQDTPVLPQNPGLTLSTEFSLESSPPVIKTSSKQDFSLPSEINPDVLYSPEVSPLSADDVVAANNSETILDYPSDVFSGMDQTNETSILADFAPPIILEPGPVIPEKIPEAMDSAPKLKETFNNQTTTRIPEMIKMTKAAEITTPAPLTTTYQTTTITSKPKVTTHAPELDLKVAFESQSKLSEFLMREMSSSLKALNVTSSDDKKQPNTPETSKPPTESKIPQKADSPTVLQNSKPTGIPPASKDKPSSIQTSTEFPPSMGTPLQQNRQSDLAPLTAPKPIKGEVPELLFAEKVSAIVTTSVNIIRSENIQFGELCNKLNELAPLVDLPPLDVCSEIPLIDYLLHVLNAVTYSLVGER